MREPVYSLLYYMGGFQLFRHLFLNLFGFILGCLGEGFAFVGIDAGTAGVDDKHALGSHSLAAYFFP